jgi:hypothetical protein
MALKINIETESGIKVDGAYCRVEYPYLTKDSVSFNLRKYVVSDKPFFEESFYSTVYNLEGDNPIKQAYEYLKNLPEFADAVDV